MFGRFFTEVAPNIFMNTYICTCESSWLESGHEINIAVIKSHKRSLAISVSRDTKNKCATATFKNKGMFAVGRFLNPPNPSVLLQALFVNLTVMSVYHIVIYCILNQSTSMFLNVVLASFRSWTAICLTQRCPAVATRLSAVWGSTWLDSLLSWTAFSLDSAPVPDIADHKFKEV